VVSAPPLPVKCSNTTLNYAKTLSFLSIQIQYLLIPALQPAVIVCGTYGLEDRWGDLREGDHLEDLGVDGSIILKKWDGAAWTGLLQ
jgi:hypothetical protein